MEEIEKKERRDGFWLGYLMALATLLAVGVVWWLIFRPVIILNEDASGLTSSQMRTLLEKENGMIRRIQNEYILEDLTNEEVMDGAYQGIMDVLDDKYADYYDKEEFEKIRRHTDGSYGGIGITLTNDWEIVGVAENGPAQEAGIRTGDIIRKVQGIVIADSDLSLEELQAQLKGNIGDVKTMTLYRPSTDTEYDVELTLQEIVTQTVFWHMLDQEIAYLQITAFDKVTQEQFNIAWQEIQESGAMKGLVLDLRGNLGGNLDTVISIANTLVPKGLIAYTEDKAGTREEYYSEGEGCGVPMAVLVNEYSASASELLCGALKDRGVAKVVGVTTYGKGIVQTTWSLSDGTAYKMTTGKYYTPNGVNIQGTGIEPDIYIDLTEEQRQMEEVPEDEDMQLQTAIEAVRTELGS